MPEMPVLSKRKKSPPITIVVLPAQSFYHFILKLDRDKNIDPAPDTPSFPYLDHPVTYQPSSLGCRELSLDPPITCL